MDEFDLDRGDMLKVVGIWDDGNTHLVFILFWIMYANNKQDGLLGFV